MASSYKTPGVYVEEISLFPPSVAQVETAVPAFIGYTAEHKRRGSDLKLVPTKIRSLAEYEEAFGKAPQTSVTSVDLDSENNVVAAKLNNAFINYDAIRLFFANGGSKCYIISIGKFPATTGDANSADFHKGLAALEKEDEPTLILFPDAIHLSADKMIGLQQAALEQAAKLGDRFCILDTRPQERDGNGQVTVDFIEKVEAFRNAIGVRNLKYGAAYGPYLKTNLEKTFSYRDIKGKITRGGSAVGLKALSADSTITKSIEILDLAVKDVDELNTLLPGGLPALETAYLEKENDFKTKINDPGANIGPQQTAYKNLLLNVFDILKTKAEVISKNTGGKFAAGVVDAKGKPIRTIIDDLKASIGADAPGALYSAANTLLALATHGARTGADLSGLKKTDLATDWGAFVDGAADDYYATDPGPLNGDDKTNALRANMKEGAALAAAAFKGIYAEMGNLLDTARGYESTYENALVAIFPILKNIIDRTKNTVTEQPPSGAIAGVYSSVDATRGVHKAPANVSLNSVVGVAMQVTHEQQQDLNVDVVAGKSINVIRPFTGKGILVWGARTLAGNDNEWRYVSVRRFFNMVEESTKKASEQFVFEPNDANTWTKVKAMIENFLINQWRAGALAGSTPEQAFFVNVGLGKTMTAQDVLEGKMIVEIGMAAVRPAEFIILRFSHKMQEA
ncbi:phage tail sheath subtilisin-like domain-containing protein [Pelagicoccus sp. NFK12]|uniref:Phage tail sheath subtilisin-like domain-containing protein n=1 Tax=Pelagicoccus enzymogenes TaxID=2773457 RepID=A0A927F958_9BACT|nr:phage tail sheath C-terminal domain-containing protein [Pelagicoccus enzymogenes]MBD5780637.1 phage tail sheath subtilisin-like domain-containing protein [Pelagicoccus enzymogenes]